MRRGACPSLAAPMPTGDGLLARIPAGPMPPARWIALAEAATRSGNGLLEITARGNLQIRGLTPTTLAPFAAAIGEGWPTDPLVTHPPLGGLDPTEAADPRPLAAAIRAAAPPLPPKFAIAVDGGGALHLDALAADCRLAATAAGWVLLDGDEASPPMPEAVALAALLTQLANPARRSCLPPMPRPLAEPIGLHPLRHGLALGIAGAFGQIEAPRLAAYAEAAAAAGATTLTGAPGRALLALGSLDPEPLRAAAHCLGLITQPEDPRRRIAACAGRPACASAEIATRPLAESLASHLPPGLALHISGCPKGCAHPGRTGLTLVGIDGRIGLVPGATARDRPVRMLDAEATPDLIASLQDAAAP
jgi:precorrin-3B synthase